MMSLAVECPCGKVLNVPESRAGKELKCPACGETIIIPTIASVSGTSQQRPTSSGTPQQRPAASSGGPSAPRREAPRPTQQPASRPAPAVQNAPHAQDDLFGGFGGASGGGMASSGMPTSGRPKQHKPAGIPNWIWGASGAVASVALLLILVSLATKSDDKPAPVAAAPPAQAPPSTLTQVDPSPAPPTGRPGGPMPAFAGRIHHSNMVGTPFNTSAGGAPTLNSPAGAMPGTARNPLSPLASGGGQGPAVTSTRPLRSWSNSSGTKKVEARFVEFKDGVVKLQKPEGKIVSLPIEKLSDADQALVRKLVAGG